METTTIRKIGGSVFIVIPSNYAKELNLTPGKHLDVTLENGRIILTPWPGENQQEEITWKQPIKR